MNKRLLFIILIVGLSLLWIILDRQSFVQEENRYYCTKGHFSFIIPDGWERGPQEDVDRAFNLTEYGEKIRHGSGYDLPIDHDSFAIFHKNESFGTHILTYFDGQLKLSEQELEELRRECEQTNSLVSNDFKKELKKILLNVEPDKLIYDAKRNMYFIRRTDDLIALNTRIFGRYGSIVLKLVTLNEDYTNELEDFQQIVNSFRFNSGYGYDGTAQVARPHSTEDDEADGFILKNMKRFWWIIVIILAIPAWFIYTIHTAGRRLAKSNANAYFSSRQQGLSHQEAIEHMINSRSTFHPKKREHLLWTYSRVCKRHDSEKEQLDSLIFMIYKYELDGTWADRRTSSMDIRKAIAKASSKYNVRIEDLSENEVQDSYDNSTNDNIQFEGQT